MKHSADYPCLYSSSLLAGPTLPKVIPTLDEYRHHQLKKNFLFTFIGWSCHWPPHSFATFLTLDFCDCCCISDLSGQLLSMRLPSWTTARERSGKQRTFHSNQRISLYETFDSWIGGSLFTRSLSFCCPTFNGRLITELLTHAPKPNNLCNVVTQVIWTPPLVHPQTFWGDEHIQLIVRRTPLRIELWHWDLSFDDPIQ